MPVIKVDIGSLTEENKIELIKKLTQVTAEITRIPQDAFMVVINELSDQNIGIGGRTIGELKQIAKTSGR